MASFDTGQNPIASSGMEAVGARPLPGTHRQNNVPFVQASFFKNGRGTQPVSIRAMTLRPGRVSTLSVFCRCVLLQKAGGKRFVLAGCCALPWSGVLGTE